MTPMARRAPLVTHPHNHDNHGKEAGTEQVEGQQNNGKEQPGEGRLSRRFESSDLATREVLALLMHRLSLLRIDEDDMANAELLLAEALNNVREHAYRSGPGPVELVVDISRSGIACLVCDRGQPMPFGMIPDPPLPMIDPPDIMPEGGFGWHIIRCLSTDLHYLRSDGWNRLSFRVPFGGFD